MKTMFERISSAALFAIVCLQGVGVVWGDDVASYGSNSYSSIQEAISAAVSDAGAEGEKVVSVTAGTYEESLSVNGDVTLLFGGNVTVTSFLLGDGVTLKLSTPSLATFSTTESLGGVPGGIAVGRTANQTEKLLIGSNVTVDAALVAVGYASGATGEIEVQGNLVGAYLKVGYENACAAGTLRVTGGAVTATAEFIFGHVGVFDLESGTVFANVNAPNIDASASLCVAPVTGDSAPLLTFANSVTINGTVSVPTSTTLTSGTVYKLAAVTGTEATLANNASYSDRSWMLSVDDATSKVLLLSESTVVAQVGSTPYYLLQDAVDAVMPGGTVTVLANGLSAEITKSQTIVYTGFEAPTITAASGYAIADTDTSVENQVTYTVSVASRNFYWFGTADDGGLWTTPLNWSTAWNDPSQYSRAPGANSADSIDFITSAAVKLPVGTTQIGAITIENKDQLSTIAFNASDGASALSPAQLTFSSLGIQKQSITLTVGQYAKLVHPAEWLGIGCSLEIEQGGEFENSGAYLAFTSSEATYVINGTLNVPAAAFAQQSHVNNVTVGSTGAISANTIELTTSGCGITLNGGTVTATSGTSFSSGVSLTFGSVSAVAGFSAGTVTGLGSEGVVSVSVPSDLVAGTYNLISWNENNTVNVGAFSLTEDVNRVGDYTLTAGASGLVLTVAASDPISDVHFDYYASYTNAIVTATVGAAGTYQLKFGDTLVGETTATGAGPITFDNVDVRGTELGGTINYTVTDGINSQDGSATKGSVTSSGWMAWSKGGTQIGSWADGDGTALDKSDYGDEAYLDFVGTNIYNAVGASTGDVVTVATSVKFGDAADETLVINADAQAAIRIVSDEGAMKFHVLTGENSWTPAFNDTLGAPNGDSEYALAVTLNYGTQKYGVKVNDTYVLTNATGGAEFALATAASAMSKVQFLGAGSFKSLAGEFLSTGYSVDVGTVESATNVVVSTEFVAQYMGTMLAKDVNAALNPNSTALQANGYNYFSCYSLGLNPTETNDKPIVDVTVGSDGKFVATLKHADGTDIDPASNVALTLSVLAGDTPDSVTTVAEVVSEGTGAAAQFKIDPANVSSVKYYKLKVDIGAK